MLKISSQLVAVSLLSMIWFVSYGSGTGKSFPALAPHPYKKSKDRTYSNAAHHAQKNNNGKRRLKLPEEKGDRYRRSILNGKDSDDKNNNDGNDEICHFLLSPSFADSVCNRLPLH